MSLTEKLQKDNLELKEALQKCLNYFMIDLEVQGAENETQEHTPHDLMVLLEEVIVNTHVKVWNQISLFDEDKPKPLSIPEIKESLEKPRKRLQSTYDCVFSISKNGIINNLTIAKEEIEELLKDLER